MLPMRFVYLGLLMSFAFGYAKAFDHSFSEWNKILEQVVVSAENGKSTQVKYASLKADKAPLEKVTKQLSGVSLKEFESFSQKEQMAFLANSYNAFMIKLVVDNYPIKSVKKLGIPFVGPWKKNYIPLFGKNISLDDIEHGKLRKNYKEPRIHFAVNCASVGCPPLRKGAFTASNWEQQLEEQGKFFFSNNTQNSFDKTKNILRINSIFSWFQEDFESAKHKKDAGVAEFASRYINQMNGVNPATVKVEYTEYNWDLNDASAKAETEKKSGALPKKFDRVRFAGSTTVAPLITSLSKNAEFKSKFNIPLQVDTQGGSKGGLLALASGDADVAMVSSDVGDKEKLLFGNKEIGVQEIGKDALAIVVSKDVVAAGITNVSINTLKAIYSSQFTTWKQVADNENVKDFNLNAPLVFFNKEPGRGTREAFLHFVYGKPEIAPSTQHPVVGSNQEVVSRLSRAKGAMSILSASWVSKSSEIAALSVNGVFPNSSTIAKKTYPFVRPLNLVFLRYQEQDLSELLTITRSPFAIQVYSSEGIMAASNGVAL
jgi:ABC-type phosphate transport system substrate-binding protein